MKFHILLLAAAVAPLLVACAKQPSDGAQAPPSAPATAPPVENLPQAVLPDGATVVIELAVTADEVTQGLMFRPSMPPDRGMLFVFGELHFPSFWMKNTWIPLDIVFLDHQGVVVDVVADAQPCAAEPCPRYVSEVRALAVLELVAGAAARHGVVKGARIAFSKVSGYPAER